MLNRNVFREGFREVFRVRGQSAPVAGQPDASLSGSGRTCRRSFAVSGGGR